MCHLVLLLPVLAIPLFWLAPLAVAVLAYGVILIISGWVYYLAIRAMRQQVETGVEALVHSTGEVIGMAGERLRVRVHSEIWTAESTDRLQPGDRIEITGIKGLMLKVRRLGETGAASLVRK